MVGGIDVCQKEIEEDIGIKEFEKLGKKIIKIITIKKLGENKTFTDRSEEHTSELQSRRNLVCRLLLEKKKNNIYILHLLP